MIGLQKNELIGALKISDTPKELKDKITFMERNYENEQYRNMVITEMVEESRSDHDEIPSTVKAQRTSKTEIAVLDQIEKMGLTTSDEDKAAGKSFQ